MKKKTGVGFYGKRGSFVYYKGVEDDIGKVGGKAGVFGDAVAFQTRHILTVGFQQDGLGDSVCHEFKLILYPVWLLVLSLRYKTFDKHEYRVFFPYLYIMEVFAAHSVYVDAEVGIRIPETYRGNDDSFFRAVRHNQPCGRGAEVGEDGVEADGVA